MRWYSPDTGRWFSRDPIGQKGGKNLYAFVANRPVDHWDAVGLINDTYFYHKACACLCRDVQVTFNPGGDQFQWAWRPTTRDRIGHQRYGSDMWVEWKVEGDPRKCKFRQDERPPNVFFAVRDNPPGGELKTATPGSYELNDNSLPVAVYTRNGFTYLDQIGVFFHKGDEGDWTIVMSFTAELTCESTDGSRMIKKVPLNDMTTVIFPP
jgi:uncharacterized protein RhaS with RHS repeats